MRKLWFVDTAGYFLVWTVLIYTCMCCAAYTRRWNNAGLMLVRVAQRENRHWSNVLFVKNLTVNFWAHPANVEPKLGKLILSKHWLLIIVFFSWNMHPLDQPYFKWLKHLSTLKLKKRYLSLQLVLILDLTDTFITSQYIFLLLKNPQLEWALKRRTHWKGQL